MLFTQITTALKFTALFFLLPLVSFTQTPEAMQILKGSQQKFESIVNGKFISTYSIKYMSSVDTIHSTYSTQFRRLPSDSLFGAAFSFQSQDGSAIQRNTLYNGEDVFRRETGDTVLVTTTHLWMEWLQAIKHNNHLYPYLIPMYGSPYRPKYFDDTTDYGNLFKGGVELHYIGKENIGQFKTHHVKVRIADDTTEVYGTIKRNNYSDYWINIEDSVLVQMEKDVDIFVDGDSLHQYSVYSLLEYDLNKEQYSIIPSPEELWGSVIYKDYVPYQRPEPLSKNELVPSWSLEKLEGGILSLDSMKGKLVLIDFFYESCFPCMKALPALERLHEKYKDKGLQIVGINPIDKDTLKLKEFVERKGVKYPVLLADNELSKQYKVAGYPALFLIDKSGRLIHFQPGYGESTEENFEKLILENL